MAVVFGQYGKHRFWEIIPGFLSWSILCGLIFLAFVFPEAAIIFIILFDLYWMLRVFYFVIHVLAAYRTYRATLAVDWWERVRTLPRHEEIYHVVLLPFYKEERAIIEASLLAILKSAYRMDRVIVVLGCEERAGEGAQETARALCALYGSRFFGCFFTVHGRDIPGEIPGKGSNLRAMAQELQRFLDARGISYDSVLVSAFDIDTLAHPQYLAKVTELFLTVPNPTRTSFQPLALFDTTMWTAPAPVRTAAFGTTFWLLSELVRPERLWTFSSHTMPMRMLVDVGFWEPDLVSEDSRIFMQAFLRYDGDYRVTPVFLPVSMDTVVGDSYSASLQALYKQQRRWAWGVEHIPYMIAEFARHPRIPFSTKFFYVFNHFEGMLTWSTASWIIFILGYLPFFTLHGAAQSALVANAPFTLEFMMRGATLGVFVTGCMSFLFLPPRPPQVKRISWVFMVLQWFFLPITFLFFGSLPALDAQTRMMFGKYLGFNVTAKSSASRTSSPV